MRKTEWILKILKKREKRKGLQYDKKMIVMYDLSQFEALKDVAAREGTTVSGIINNLFEDFLNKMDASPQTIIEDFRPTHPEPVIQAGEAAWNRYLSSLSLQEYKEFDRHLNMVMHLANRRYAEL